MNLLQIVQEFCLRTGLAKPAYVVGNPDPQITQLQALLNELCAYMTKRWYWEELNQEAIFTSVATESQGLLSVLAPNAFIDIIPDTMFDRTQHLCITGPVSQVEWQALKALSNTGPLYRYRIRKGQLYFTPTPTAGHTCAFEYMSSAAIYNSATLTYKRMFDSDLDEFLLDYELLILGIRWKWKSEKGLPYAEEFSTFEEMATTAAGRSGTKPQINMACEAKGPVPGIFVPAGSWRIP